MKNRAVSENSKRNQKVQSRKIQNKRTMQYGVSILAFVLLIVSALWLPRLFFDFSDALTYGKVNLLEQEKPDVLTLTTDYEESLYKRLAGFAEGLAGQRLYYVDEQPKEVTEEIRDFLYTPDLRDYAEGIYTDVIVGMFAESLGFAPDDFARKTGLELYQWNQYVIYSDDYAKGVNFILWCFGLKNSLGDNMTILMDAHDYTVYAIQITGGTERSALNVSTMNISFIEYYETDAPGEEPAAYIAPLYTQRYTWMSLGIYYDIFTPDVLEEYMYKVESIQSTWKENAREPARIAGVLKDSAGNDVEVYLDADSNVPYGADGEGWYGRGVDGILYYDLPFQGNKITFDMNGIGEVYDAGMNIKSFTMGIREIYEMIPEFM